MYLSVLRCIVCLALSQSPWTTSLLSGSLPAAWCRLTVLVPPIQPPVSSCVHALPQLLRALPVWSLLFALRHCSSDQPAAGHLLGQACTATAALLNLNQSSFWALIHCAPLNTSCVECNCPLFQCAVYLHTFPGNRSKDVRMKMVHFHQEEEAYKKLKVSNYPFALPETLSENRRLMEKLSFQFSDRIAQDLLINAQKNPHSTEKKLQKRVTDTALAVHRTKIQHTLKNKDLHGSCQKEAFSKTTTQNLASEVPWETWSLLEQYA